MTGVVAWAAKLPTTINPVIAQSPMSTRPAGAVLAVIRWRSRMFVSFLVSTDVQFREVLAALRWLALWWKKYGTLPVARVLGHLRRHGPARRARLRPAVRPLPQWVSSQAVICAGTRRCPRARPRGRRYGAIGGVAARRGGRARGHRRVPARTSPLATPGVRGA